MLFDVEDQAAKPGVQKRAGEGEGKEGEAKQDAISRLFERGEARTGVQWKKGGLRTGT